MAAAATAPVKYAGRDYLIEMIIVAALQIAGALAGKWLMHHASSHSLAIAAAFIPAVPVYLMMVVIWRYYRRIDEFEKQKFLETLAISFGIGTCLVCTYGFLADAGLPELALTWAWPTLVITWALAGGIRHFVNR